MKILRILAVLIFAFVAVVLLMDTFGGYIFDGPVGPIPGGRMSGTVSEESAPDWSQVEPVIELEIRPSNPWSLSVWNAVVDGELYVPSAKGESRRWPAVALEDPRVRVRTGAKIFERTLVRVTDPALIVKVRTVLNDRYELDGDPTATDDGLWVFHLAPR